MRSTGNTWRNCTAGLSSSRAAIRCWERILAQTPDDRAHPHLPMGHSQLHELNRPVDAECHHVAAVAVEPSSAEARLENGVFFQDQGKFDEAEAAFRATIALQPTYDAARTTWHPSSVAELPDDDLAATLGRLGDPGISQDSRSRLLFGARAGLQRERRRVTRQLLPPRG